MSFRLFIYYCAICGGWAAFVGWALGRMLATSQQEIPRAGIKGLFLGLAIALGLSLVDALWNLSGRQVGQILLRVFVAVIVGCVGGLLGGFLGQALYGSTSNSVLQAIFTIFGWTLAGLLIGASIGVFEVLASLVQQQDMSGSVKKVVNGLLGGT